MSVWLDAAALVAKQSKCKKRQVGCIITSGDRCITSGYNGPVRELGNCCEDIGTGETLPFVLHAEANAVLAAAKSGISLEGGTCYVTVAPCVHCASMLIQAGIHKVVYGYVSSSSAEGLAVLDLADIEVERGVL